MGYELKRVPLDFNAPLNKVWSGFRNPHPANFHQCTECNGRGASPTLEHYNNLWYGKVPFKPEDFGSAPHEPTHPVIRARAERNVTESPRFYGTGEAAIAAEAQRLCDLFNARLQHHVNEEIIAALCAEGRLMSFTHNLTKEEGWVPKNPAYIPTPKEVNDWSMWGAGHDSINSCIVARFLCKKEDAPQLCAKCQGEGSIWDNPEEQIAYESWVAPEVPEGPGYQLWENVTEGSPISPVFESSYMLARWLSRHEESHRSANQWMEFIEGPGYSPSMIFTPEKGMQEGIDAVTSGRTHVVMHRGLMEVFEYPDRYYRF